MKKIRKRLEATSGTASRHSDHCTSLFSHITSSSRALWVIVTHVAQRKLSLLFSLIPDMDKAPRWSSPVWSANNHTTCCCWKNTLHVHLVSLHNRLYIVCDQSPEWHDGIDINRVETLGRPLDWLHILYTIFTVFACENTSKYCIENISFYHYRIIIILD